MLDLDFLMLDLEEGRRRVQPAESPMVHSRRQTHLQHHRRQPPLHQHRPASTSTRTQTFRCGVRERQERYRRHLTHQR